MWTLAGKGRSKERNKLAQLWMDLNHCEDEAVFFMIEFHYL